MVETSKSAQPRQSAKAKQPQKVETALDEKKLDEVTGGVSLYQSCATGQHFKKATIPG